MVDSVYLCQVNLWGILLKYQVLMVLLDLKTSVFPTNFQDIARIQRHGMDHVFCCSCVEFVIIIPMRLAHTALAFVLADPWHL